MGGEGRVSVPVERSKKNIECLVPMRLSGRTYAVYQQLSEEKRADSVPLRLSYSIARARANISDIGKSSTRVVA